MVEELYTRITVKHLIQVLAMLETCSDEDGVAEASYREGVIDAAAHIATCTAAQDFGCSDGVPTEDAREMLGLDKLPESPGELERHLFRGFRDLVVAHRP